MNGLNICNVGLKMEMSSSVALSSNMENIAPHVLRNVSKELVSLVREPLEGITIINNEQDITDVQAVITGPGGTPYAGGKFHVRLVLSKEFPQSPPKGFFITKIFHPNVSINGEICVNTLNKDWKPDLGLKHVLLTIKCLLIAPNPESALNEEAGKLLLEQYDEYRKRAKMMTEIHGQSKKHGESDPSTTLEEPQAKKHAGDKRKTRILKEKKKILKRL